MPSGGFSADRPPSPQWPTGMRNTSPGHVLEETCGALIGFENGAFASATASYIGPEGMPDPQPRFICAEGGVLTNADGPPGKDSITVLRGGRSEVRTFDNEPSPFVRQAAAFLDAMEDRREARNPPEDALLDVEIAEAVSVSAQRTQDGFAGRKTTVSTGDRFMATKIDEWLYSDAVDDRKVAGSLSCPVCGPRRFLGDPRTVCHLALPCHLVGGGLAHGRAWRLRSKATRC